MDPQDDHSVTQWIEQLRSSERADYQEAARQIWQRYLSRLLELARRNLSPRLRQREDEEDILQSVYKSFCLRQQRGEYELNDRSDLWRLLVAITENKARGAAARHGRLRRDFRREQPEPGAGASGEGRPGLLDNVPEPQPTPDAAAALTEELRLRLDSLPQDLRRVALWKLEGYSNEEIAQAARMDCAVRTVERKLERIRGIWEKARQTTAD